MKKLINKFCFWWLKIGKTNTIEGFKPSKDLELSHHRFVVYEQGRHKLVWDLQHR